MSVIIKDLPKITIVSPFGERYRQGHKENHLGVDIRVVDGQYNVKSVLAPEEIKITKVVFDRQWGHWIAAKPTKKNELGIDQFEFWHTTPMVNPGEIVQPGSRIGTPEAGYVALHLHFVTWVKNERVNPVPYLKSIGAEIENVKG